MFYFDRILDKEVLKSDILPDLNHFFTTRESFIKTKDKTNFEKVRKNLEDFKNFFNLDKIVSPEQRHTDNVSLASFERDYYPETDALVLVDKGIGIFLNFADCTPIILYDTKNKAAAIAHGGWRGTAQKISLKTFLFMNKNFNTAASVVKAVIGPCICFKHFETSKEIAEKLAATCKNQDGIILKKEDKFYADLKEINKRQLLEAGIKEIDVTDFCTVCNNDKFFSYRKENKTTNRMSAFICL